MDRKAINFLADVSCVIGELQTEARHEKDRRVEGLLVRIQNHLEAAVINYLEANKEECG